MKQQTSFTISLARQTIIYPWKTAPGAATAIPFIDLTPDNLPDYIGKRTLPIGTAKTFIFSFRLCLPTGPSKWLKNPDTKCISITTTWNSVSPTPPATAVRSPQQATSSSSTLPHSTVLLLERTSQEITTSHPILRRISFPENADWQNSSSPDSKMWRKTTSVPSPRFSRQI